MAAGMGAPATLGSEFTGRPGIVLARLQSLYPALIDLSLGRLEVLLARLGHPERVLPPVVHVAGTNGKGSTCANLRAIAEASGWKAHVMTSPHLVSVTERFRVSGELVSEDGLLNVLEEIERVNEGAPITIFEVLTAAGFLLFARNPADIAIIEVGLGGRLDATNVISKPRVCAISSIGLDHQAFLGNSLAAIAREKAGIIKAGVPVVCAVRQDEALDVVQARAMALGAPLWRMGRDWMISRTADGLVYRDDGGTLSLPFPSLAGTHQATNTGLAVAALRAGGFAIPDAGWQGVGRTHWPARLQRLHGHLARSLPDGWEVWLDGGHNPAAGEALGQTLAGWADRPVHVVVGMKQTKDVAGFLAPLLPFAASVQAVCERNQHLAVPVEDIVAASGGVAIAGPTVAEAIARLRSLPPGRILICGSLYLAGIVLNDDGWVAQ